MKKKNQKNKKKTTTTTNEYEVAVDHYENDKSLGIWLKLISAWTRASL